MILDAIDIRELTEYAADQDFDFTAAIFGFLSGESEIGEVLRSLLKNGKNAFAKEASNILTAALAPSGVLLMMKMLFPGKASAQKTIALICRLSCITAFFALFDRMRMLAEDLLNECIVLSDILTPVLISASALAGAEYCAALLGPMAALGAEFIQKLFSQWGIAICFAAAGTSAAGNLSFSIHLERMHKFLKRFLKWSVGGLVAAFTLMLSLQGRLGAGRDSIAARTAKYTIENLIPVIGGNVSDSLDALLSVANMVKNAIGASGLLLIISVGFAPLSQMLASVLLLQFTAAITEPLADDNLSRFTSQIGDCVEMLLILCMAAIMLCCLLIGSCIKAAAVIVQ